MVEHLNAMIMSLTMQIQEEHPELSDFLNEMPVSIPNEKVPAINSSILKAYFDSVSSLLEGYLQGQRPATSSLYVDLPTLLRQARQKEDWIVGYYSTLLLINSETLCIVLVSMHEETEMTMVPLKAPISLYVVEGVLKVTTQNEYEILLAGQLIVLSENTKHWLFALEDTAFLLTMLDPIA
jgi:hypothetical protein